MDSILAAIAPITDEPGRAAGTLLSAAALPTRTAAPAAGAAKSAATSAEASPTASTATNSARSSRAAWACLCAGAALSSTGLITKSARTAAETSGSATEHPWPSIIGIPLYALVHRADQQEGFVRALRRSGLARGCRCVRRPGNFGFRRRLRLILLQRLKAPGSSAGLHGGRLGELEQKVDWRSQCAFLFRRVEPEHANFKCVRSGRKFGELVTPGFVGCSCCFLVSRGRSDRRARYRLPAGFDDARLSA